MMNSFKTALLLSYICIASFSAAIITPALPHIQTYFDLSKGAVEWVVSIFLLGYVIYQYGVSNAGCDYDGVFAVFITFSICIIVVCIFYDNFYFDNSTFV